MAAKANYYFYFSNEYNRRVLFLCVSKCAAALHFVLFIQKAKFRDKI